MTGSQHASKKNAQCLFWLCVCLSTTFARSDRQRTGVRSVQWPCDAACWWHKSGRTNLGLQTRHGAQGAMRFDTLRDVCAKAAGSLFDGELSEIPKRRVDGTTTPRFFSEEAAHL